MIDRTLLTGAMAVEATLTVSATLGRGAAAAAARPAHGPLVIPVRPRRLAGGAAAACGGAVRLPCPRCGSRRRRSRRASSTSTGRGRTRSCRARCRSARSRPRTTPSSRRSTRTCAARWTRPSDWPGSPVTTPRRSGRAARSPASCCARAPWPAGPGGCTCVPTPSWCLTTRCCRTAILPWPWLLRMERLAPAVLAVLIDGVPRIVHVEEPRQGLQFESARQTATRPIPRGRASCRRGTSTRASRLPMDDKTSWVPVRFRPGAPGVLNLRKTRDALLAVPGTNMGSDVDSAEFAIQMLRYPYREVFGPTGPQTDPETNPSTAGTKAGWSRSSGRGLRFPACWPSSPRRRRDRL